MVKFKKDENIDTSENANIKTKTVKGRLSYLYNVAFWPIAYLLLIIAIALSGIFIFKNYYYSSIYVSGSSMNPTLVGEEKDCDYGIVDKHTIALKNIKRYQIVTTHYPDTGTRLMIKRVLFKPGDTFEVVNNEMRLYEDSISNNYKILDTTPYFSRNIQGTFSNFKKTTLKDDEYFVAGDNWSNSYDCFDFGKPITFDYLIGVLVEIQGRCTVNSATKEVIEKRPGQKRYFNGVDF